MCSAVVLRRCGVWLPRSTPASPLFATRHAHSVPQGKSAAQRTTSWRSAGVPPAVCEALQASGYAQPNAVQQSVLARLMNPAAPAVVLGAETGSGKTLAYLVPMLSRLIDGSGMAKPCERPAGLIVLPSRELMAQVFEVVEAVAAPLGVVVEPVFPQDTIATFDAHAHLLLTTPAALATVDFRELTGYCHTLVLDEFDALLVDQHTSHVWRLIQNLAPRSYRRRKPILAREPSAQVYLVGATLPDRGTKSVMEDLVTRMPKTDIIRSDRLHAPVARLRQVFHKLGRAETAEDKAVVKEAAVAECLETLAKAGRKALVFCNTVSSAVSLAASLRANGFDVGEVHKQVTPQDRQGTLDQLDTGTLPFIVCTDLLARGIDVHVDAVVMADFPQDVISYMHRIGRTARNDKPGVVHAFVDESGPQAVLASEIRLLVEQQRNEWLTAAAAHTPEEAASLTMATATDDERAFRSLFSRNRSHRHRIRKNGSGF